MRLSWVLAVALLLAIGVCLFRNAQNPLKVPLVQRAKLLDVSALKSKTAFICPDALEYTLLIAFPTNDVRISGTGEVYLNDGRTNILRLTLSSTSLVSCTWLDSLGLSAFIIKMPDSTNNQELSFYLRGGFRYVIMTEDIPVGSSLWLDYRYPSGWNLTKKDRTRFQRIQAPSTGER
jgi:hypothetical protein